MEKEEKKSTYYFTFGCNHVHDGQLMADYWVEIHGTDEEARDKMFELYGEKWSMQYSEENFDRFWFPKGCYKRIVIE